MSSFVKVVKKEVQTKPLPENSNLKRGKILNPFEKRRLERLERLKNLKKN